VRDIEFARDFFGTLAVCAGDRDDLRAFTVLNPGICVVRAKPAPMIPMRTTSFISGL